MKETTIQIKNPILRIPQEMLAKIKKSWNQKTVKVNLALSDDNKEIRITIK